MKLKNSNCDETQKRIVIKLKKQIVIKLEELNCGEAHKTQIVTKL